MDIYTEQEWTDKYKPIECIAEEELAIEVDEKYIWTEKWDWDNDRPFLVSGFLGEDHDAVSWYRCEVPWEGDEQLIAEKAED